MKAGAAYLPLDPALPRERLSFTLRDADAKIVLGDAQVLGTDQTAASQIVSLERDGRIEHALPGEPLRTNIEASDLAYIIYTSGSTGYPKGVEITHGGLANLVAWHHAAFELRLGDRASHLSPVGFDASVWEVWPYLSAGATVYIAGDAVARDPQALRDWLSAHAITLSFMPTPIAERFINLDFPADIPLRVLLTGADTLHHYPVRSLPFALYNNYGPTEASVVATSGLVKPLEGPAGDLPSIGRPIRNTEIHLLDATGARVPDGAEGEICISGSGLARGYRGRPDLTAEKFQWVAFDEQQAVRVYRTGDRGRRATDGAIAFLGRIDDQIKIRGFRVEPREIETALNTHRGVLESAVVAHEFAPGDERLVAYVVGHPRRRLELDDIQQELAAYLPTYMIPGAYVELDALPLTANGKIDRADLRTRDVGEQAVARAFTAPGSEIEDRVMHLVGDLLKLQRVSIDEDFFLLGGHSLLGTQLIARLRDAFGVNIGLRFIFESPTIRALAVEVERLMVERLTTVGAKDVASQWAANGAYAPIQKRRA
jgi:amino acid adenylation domain-containing protein